MYVDRDLWAKVVLNLLSNALKFTFDRRHHRAAGRRRTDGDAELTVSDTGTGIPEHEVGHLFERFHRVSGARSRTHEGSGIGLALVAELVALHGGRVERRERAGPGHDVHRAAAVRQTRTCPPSSSPRPRRPPPRRVSAVAEGFLAEATHWTDPDAADLSRPSGDTGQDRPRILVVDDNADIREYVAGLLADDYAVQTAVDGLDGLEQARRLPPDLVLTDVMMPRMDGFELLAALQADATTVGVPVVMLSARAGEEGTLQGLDAGADDYLVKPFTARELLARVRANLELDRARRTRRQLERSRSLLAEAQRLARVGSWEIDLGTGQAEFSDEYLRVMGRTREELDGRAWGEIIDTVVHPEDKDRVAEDLSNEESGFHYEFRVIRGDGSEILVAIFGEAVLDDRGDRVGLRGSVQDITERRAAEEALAMAAANAEAAAREHAIADQLQRSLLPQKGFDLDHLEVATYYRAGVEGTQVGGDWYDVIELGGGRTALVVGDVMGRGVRAAAVMGQLRSAVRAYARLDLPPADLLESLDGLVRDLGEDQIVTCIYAVFDPADQLPAVRQRRAPAADRRGPGRGVPAGRRRREPAARRGPVQPDPAPRRPGVQRPGGALHRRAGGAARRGHRRRHRDAGPPGRGDGRAGRRRARRSWSRRCCPTVPTTTSPSWWRASTRRPARRACRGGSSRTRRRWPWPGTWSPPTSRSARCRPRWSPTPRWPPASWSPTRCCTGGRRWSCGCGSRAPTC